MCISWTPVHPHGRGERTYCYSQCQRYSGSSPRAWGTGARPHWSCPDNRFIPTGVGNGRLVVAVVKDATVHPHGRGERSRTGGTRFTLFGSSPRAWGTVQSEGFLKLGFRFIPTGVGNGLWRAARRHRGSVHPHGRGERFRRIRQNSEWAGSSPRAWGTVIHTYLIICIRRFIPTGVGNGKHKKREDQSETVHPHGRGEREYMPGIQFLHLRFIPTGVGNGCNSGPLSPRHPVHPHGRGERTSSNPLLELEKKSQVVATNQ